HPEISPSQEVSPSRCLQTPGPVLPVPPTKPGHVQKLQEKARLELNENPDVLHQDIQQVRDMIITRPDIGFLRTDDAFILRFLRARKFHQADAFRLLAQYFQYRQLNLDMFKNFKADDPGIKRALIDGFPGVLENRDHYGRKILLLFAANWDQSR
uniref:CRAL/TRIO N-terminal domain-containing protein n=1 Tax=Spermophilus dauricus TaxID=99837 RepID=A0A8C9UNT0_SPEDA